MDIETQNDTLDKYLLDYNLNIADYIKHPDYDEIFVNKKYNIPSTDGFNHYFKFMFGQEIVPGSSWSKTSVWISPNKYLKKDEYLLKYCKYYPEIGKYLLNKYSH